MSLFPALSMRWKLVLACILVQLATISALVWNNWRLTERSLSEQALLRQQEIGFLLKSSVAPLMVERDYGRIDEIFREIRRHNDIEYLILTDTRGRVIASGSAAGKPPLPASTLAAPPESVSLASRIPVVVAGQVLGQLDFGITPRFIVEARRQIVRQSLAIAGGALLLSSLFLAALGFWLTRHLKSLERASESIAQGNFEVDVDVRGRDEVGRLAAAFDRMAGQIKSQMQALQESEARSQSLLNLSTDWYWEQDEQFRFVHHEPGRAGRKHHLEMVLGKQRWELDSTLSAAEWAAHRAVLEAHETFYGLEYGIRLPDGRRRYMRVNGEPIFDAAGRFRGYRGTAADITASKRAEESLRLAASVFAKAHEGILITDGELRILDSNPTVTEWTGYEREELVGTDLRRHFALTCGEQLVETALATLREEGYWRGETVSQRKNGESFPELLTASAVHDADGRIANYIFIFSDISVLKEQQERLEHLAHYDALTRLPNRVLLADRIQQALSLAQRSGEVVAVAYLDLDGFKPVNDKLGHAAGDLLLVEVASRLRSCIRGGDTVARLGGDEFVLLIRAQDFGDCEAAMLRVLDTLAGPYAIDGKEVGLSASIGITLYPNDGADPDVLLRHADQAMYAAKQAGRNRYHLFDSEHDRRISAHRELEARVRAALPAGEFVLFYQPKVDMRRGVVIGAEALIRWQHPERGLVPPGDFLPLVEDSDFAIDLGDWVIATALAQMEAWRAQGIELPVSVNVAARQLQAEDFVERLSASLAARPQVPAAWVELEILETAALEDIQYVTRVLQRCRELGVSVALDDFGTGYSSLTYLKRLPAHLLKIDQSFIRDMLADPEDLAIVGGVIGLARAFQRRVIAEGVETPEHGVRLMQMGCNLAQGYGIARPMPAAAIPDWLRNYQPPPEWTSPLSD